MARSKTGKAYRLDDLANDLYFDASPGKSRQKKPKFKKVPLQPVSKVITDGKATTPSSDPIPAISTHTIEDEDPGRPPIRGKVWVIFHTGVFIDLSKDFYSIIRCNIGTK